jgi:hypothetical protein
MKSRKWGGIILVLTMIFLWVSCNNPAGGTGNNPYILSTPSTDPVDPAFWFGDIYEKLIERIGEVSSDGYPDITDSNGVDMGQIINCQYVCNAINAKWGTSFAPESGTASQAANCEYLLKLIDMANNNTTSFGTGSYATKQVADKTAVDTAVNTLWVSGEKFVAISGSEIAYSTDSINWTKITLPSSAQWCDITYGNGKFVVVTVSSNSKAIYSANGINWTETSLMLGSINWGSVAYGNEKFVAVAYNGGDMIAYSTDGINWTTKIAMPSQTYWHGITYGNGKFVAVAAHDYTNTVSDKAAYSTDGINWTATTMPSSSYWQSIAYGNGKFVAITISTNVAAYSTDGINWTASPTGLPSSAQWCDITYGNGKFVAIARYNNKIASAYSTDGINWTETALPSNADWRSVSYGNGKFVAVNNDKAAYSTDGINWTEVTLPSGSWFIIAYGGD